jgi:DNA-directed RNA polymerase sigma subunit (sigma70/sigma32)
MAQADLRRVEKAALSVKEAREELRVAISLARAAGETLDDIARMAGLTRQRISQILQERS